MAKANEGSGALFGNTVNCDEAVHQLYHYLFCAPCGGAVEFEAELRQVIANRCKDHVPESLMQRIAAAIDEESRQHDGGF